jgi:hypothetical protein
VGAILFEMLAGKPPHEGRTYEAVLIAICTQDAPNVRTLVPSVSEAVATLLDRALKRERAERFQSAHEFFAAIEGLRSVAPRKRYGTLVAGVIATLAGFAITAYLVARGSAAQNVDAEAAPAANGPTAPLASGAPVTVPAATVPILLPAGSAMRVAPTAPVRSVGAEKPHRPVAPKPSAHVAGGLQLSTKEP